MPIFKVGGHVTVSCWTEVEADSEAEAINIAAKRDMADFHIDGSSPVDECWHMDSDGVPGELCIED